MTGLPFSPPPIAALLLATAACGVGSGGPQEGSEVDAFVSADSATIMGDLFSLASDEMEGREVGTAGGARARAYIVAALDAAGVPAPSRGRLQPFELRRRNPQAPLREGVNVLGVIAGTERPDRFLVVTAHYDHEGVRNGQVFNGADDNASGVSGLLALARYLMAHPPRHSVALVALDGEESGLSGARALMEEGWPPEASVDLNVNLDMIARSDSVLFAAGAYHTPELEPLLLDLAEDVPVTLRLGHDRPGVVGEADWTRQSDHAVFHARGIPFVYFGVEDHPDYHAPTDDPERVDPGFFLNSVRTVIRGVVLLDQRLEDIP